MLTENNKRLHRICFTGHRPEKISRKEQDIINDLKNEILQAVNEGFSVFISGMARGVDIWAAETVLQLRSSGLDIRLICACPYNGFETGWRASWQKRYNAVLNEADLVRYISDGYSKGCFQIRNEWMVDRSAKVIAVYNGEKGETANTIKYAVKNGVPISYIKA